MTRLAALKKLLPRLAAAGLVGLLLSVISPPVGLHWLHWFVFLPMFWALRAGETRKNALLGYAMGWVGVFVLFFWIVETVIRFSNIPYPLALVILALFSTGFAAYYALVWGSVLWFRERIGLWWIAAFPAVQVACELLSPALFPYYHGVGQYRTPWVWQLGSVFGVMGVTYLIFLVNACFGEALFRRREGRGQPWKVHTLVAGLFCANLAFGSWRYDRVEEVMAQAETISVAFMQQNVTMEQRMEELPNVGIKEWGKNTRLLAKEHPEVDLVVWPEGSVAYNPTREDVHTYLANLSRKGTASPKGFDLLVGGGTVTWPDESKPEEYIAYNSCYLLDAKGLINGRYDKMVPLPFGEYMPLAHTFPWLKELIQGPGDFRAGTEPTLFQGDGYTFTTPICYEAILRGTMEKMALGDIFVNITNDAWFGDTASPHQHAMLTTISVMELGRPMFRSAYTGICWIVEPHGRILYETEPFTDVNTVHPMRLGKVTTIYSRGGWIFPWLCLAGTGGAFLTARRRVVTPPAPRA